MNFAVNGLETATTIEDAFGVGSQAGMPAQNLVVGERGGRIGWSVTGRIPRRVGFDGTVPTSWADGTRGWDGWLAPAEYPRVVEPASGRSSLPTTASSTSRSCTNWATAATTRAPEPAKSLTDWRDWRTPRRPTC